MAPRPCRFFQLGKCKDGENCPYPHIVDPNFKRKGCMHFANDKCHRGKNCTFSHAPEDIAFLKAAMGSTDSGSAGPVSTEALFKEWRYNIPLPDRIATARPLGCSRTKFCKDALELVSGDAGQVQEVVHLLASEGGCLRIREIVGQRFDQLTAAELARMFDAQILPFFKAVTHSNVASSLVLAPRVMTVYNIMYGENGQRGTQLFTAVTKHLQTLNLIAPGEPGGADMRTADAIQASLAALHKLVEVNTEAQVQVDFKMVVETLSLFFKDPLPATATFAFRSALKHLRHIQKRLGLGQALPEAKHSVKVESGRAFFELARERPGELSEDGPRHDNDHIDIRQISILPTLQEIQSPRNEYLPLADPRDWHIGGLEGLLDRHFRLLREDTVGQLRDAAKFELERLHDPQAYTRKPQGARTFVYRNVAVTDIGFDPFNGMEFVLSFDQPEDLQNRSDRQRRDWWEASKRLGYEALICLLSSEGSAAFFIVSPAPMKPRKDQETGDNIQSLHKTYTLWFDQERAHIIARPVNQGNIYPTLDQVFSGYTEHLSLVEFPGVLLPAFQPTLQAMQAMSTTLDVPFADVLAPVSTTANPNRDIDIGPPSYATRPGFRFNLSAVTGAGVPLHMDPACDAEEMTAQLATQSKLDFGQAQAVVSSLSRSLALIQGPPGTGKSYTGVQLIKILLDNKKAGKLGPIICVCYTNHALDQGLERLVDEGVSNIVRVGGNSKSERLARINLRAVVQRLDLTKTEKADRGSLTKKLMSESKEVNRTLGQMSQLGNEATLADYLQNRYPEIHAQLFSGVDEDGWEQVSYRRHGALESWLRAIPWGSGRPRTSKDLLDVHIAHMSGQERRIMYNAWKEEMRLELQDRLRTSIDAYNKLKEQLDAIKSELDLRVLHQANIIGITTSGLARHLDLIRRTGAKVLVCEEAGEVLEAHLLTALLPSVEHAILIGDHQQLRPHIQNYSLSCESKNGSQYSLDVSLFERLVQPQDVLAQSLPFCTLAVQRRMHPSISQLVRRTLYPLLEDAPSLNRPPVVGMRHRLFWMHHEHKENEGEDASVSSSRTNDHESDMVAALVKHIIHQGVYSPEDVAVITPYLGQLRKIRAKLSSTFNIVLNDRDVDDLQNDGDEDFDDATKPNEPKSVARGSLLQAIRIATVDNFQGEESKVVIVSLVRSNSKRNPGFLKTSNRINVLLSRAKNGMYIIGNANTMEQVPMWNEVIDLLKQDGCFGSSLELCCPRHEYTPMSVTKPEDFLRLSPEAGCALPCEERLSCGHSCIAKCHSGLLHNAIRCMKACTRPKPGCPHLCPHRCGDPCDPVCLETVSGVNVELDCGHHKTSLPCYQHHDLTKVLCDVEIERTVPGCEHAVTEPCHVDVDSDGYRCLEKCGASLPCGHNCQKPCSVCRGTDEDGNIRIEHGACRQACNRNYTTCSHRDKSTCHGQDPCGLCPAKCEVRCAHAICGKKCHEGCSPCLEPVCSSHCPHSACRMPCAAPCDWIPCSLRCEKYLSCGCRCPSVCGEICPPARFCQKCGSDDVKAMQADLVMFESYGEIDLDEDPCIFTGCGHIITLSSMDGIMSMPKYYEIDPMAGKITGLKTSSQPFSSDELKSCPTCRGSLRTLARYGRIVRRALLDESAKKLTAWSNRTHADLAERLAADQEQLLLSTDTTLKPSQDVKLEGNQLDQHRAIKKMNTHTRYRRAFATRNAIQVFTDKLRKEEQPYQRVRDLVETARRQAIDPPIAEFKFASSELQLREHLQAMSLLIRCDTVILSDVISMHNKSTAGRMRGQLKVDFTTNRAVCAHLVVDSRETSSIRQEVEGHLSWARFAAMECGVFNAADDEAHAEAGAYIEALNDEALDHLKQADRVCERFAGSDVDPTQGLGEEITDVRRMLHEGLSTSEMKMVVAAMAREFRVNGHWYRCANGHPFTVGECGMPMQLARCPECGAGIGGRNHQATEGVQAASDIERQFGNMQL